MKEPDLPAKTGREVQSLVGTAFAFKFEANIK